ncbi:MULTISPECIES: MerR family transcriptional regulator [Pseudomonas]|uniref:Mercuric resistance operon regulatory protein n=1 Tax=Pseudomonas fluorescens TaxID=294 RepID=A0A5E6RTT8_PSEFL|nr:MULTISPECIES: MerR family transcriptional regulator [Pseudomonas]VVM71530.1 Mercuric resistance operon regulatory protein [Pseudomonas fluorescens]
MYIGKAAQLSGATIKSIRHYERIGLLPAPRRQGSYRLYDQQSVTLLSLIKCAQKLGFSLKEMQMLVSAEQAGLPIERVRQAIAGKKAQLQAQIQALQQQHQGLLELETSLEQSHYDCFDYNA